MPNAELSINSSGKTMYVILTNGLPLCVFGQIEEAEAYLADLQLVSPGVEYEIEDVTNGRLRGHEKKVWGGIACWDLLDRKGMNFRPAWIWESEIHSIPTFKPGEEVSRWVWAKLKVTYQDEFYKILRSFFISVTAKEANKSLNTVRIV